MVVLGLATTAPATGATSGPVARAALERAVPVRRGYGDGILVAGPSITKGPGAAAAAATGWAEDYQGVLGSETKLEEAQVWDDGAAGKPRGSETKEEPKEEKQQSKQEAEDEKWPIILRASRVRKQNETKRGGAGEEHEPKTELQRLGEQNRRWQQKMADLGAGRQKRSLGDLLRNLWGQCGKPGCSEKRRRATTAKAG